MNRPPRRRVWPAPYWSGVLAVTWLALNGSLTAGHILLALVLGWAIPWWWQVPADPPKHTTPVWRRWRVGVGLLAVVVWDVLVSSWQVLRQVLGDNRKLQPAWVWMPVRLQSPRGRWWLAAIISLTPGTVSARWDVPTNRLLIHALHVEDVDALVATIRQRYEQPLLEVTQ